MRVFEKVKELFNADYETLQNLITNNNVCSTFTMDVIIGCYHLSHSQQNADTTNTSSYRNLWIASRNFCIIKIVKLNLLIILLNCSYYKTILVKIILIHYCSRHHCRPTLTPLWCYQLIAIFKNILIILMQYFQVPLKLFCLKINSKYYNLQFFICSTMQIFRDKPPLHEVRIK